MASTDDWFDFEEVRELRTEGKSWPKLGKLYNRAHTTVMRRYNHELDKRKLDRLSRNTKKNKKRIPKKKTTSAEEEIIDNIDKDQPFEFTYSEIPSTYGRLPPLHNKSNLDVELWIRKYCAFLFYWEPLDYVTEIISEIVLALKTKTLRMLLEPRNHGKTHTMVCLYAWWLVNEKKSLMVITSDASQKARIFNGIMGVLESDIVRSHYGDMIRNKQANMGEIWFHHDVRGGLDATFRVTGKDGTFIGAHPDWIDLHDPVQEEAVSELTNQRFKDEFTSTIKPITKLITCNGTRKGINDYYEFLIDQGFKPIHRRAIDKISGRWPTLDDCVVETYEYGGKKRKRILAVKQTGIFKTLGCPNFTTEELLIERILNLSSFESQYQNEPIQASGAYYNAKWWRYIDSYEMTKGNKYYIAIDPAWTEKNYKKKGDNTGIIVGALTQSKLIVVDGVLDQLTFPEIIAKVHGFLRAYPNALILLEDATAQKWLKQQLIEHGIFAIKMIPAIKNKIARLNGMAPGFENGAIWHLRNNPVDADLKLEFLQYNEMESSGSRRDDGLDALEHMYTETKPFLIKYESNRGKIKTGSWQSRELRRN